MLGCHLSDAAGAKETLEVIRATQPKAKVELVDIDISVDDAPARLMEACRRYCGGVDVLVNNAAIKRVGDPIDYPSADFDRVMAVNLRAPFLLAQTAVREFRTQGTGGLIVNVASVHDSKPLTSDIGYSISKSGLAMMTKSLAAALGPEGIRSVGVSPGAVDTPMNQRSDEEARRRFASSVPLRRVGQPNDIARVIVFLASEDATYMTGQTVYVDGGLLL